jgi:hypothetical protein
MQTVPYITEYQEIDIWNTIWDTTRTQVCKQSLLVDSAKIAVIVNLLAPKPVHQLRETLGHMGYYKKFIKGYM